MSKIADLIKKEKVSFVIPYASKLEYSTIGKDDKALTYIINKGYIESESMEVCYYFSLFLESTLVNKFARVGNVEKIRLKNNLSVFRQRVYFTDLSLLFQILKQFDVVLVIPSSFKIGISQMSNCLDSIKDLEMYFNDKKNLKYSLDTWLTDCCLVQLYIMCMIDGISINFYKNLNTMLKDGLLNRAPYICISQDKKKHISSIFIPPKEFLMLKNDNGVLIDLLSDYLEKQHNKYQHEYTQRSNDVDVPIYGFTTNNIKQDKIVRCSYACS